MKNEKVSVPSLLLMIILVAFPQISETIYTPSLPDISKALHVSNNEVQLTLSVYFAGFALGVFLLDGYRILLAVPGNVIWNCRIWRWKFLMLYYKFH